MRNAFMLLWLGATLALGVACSDAGTPTPEIILSGTVQVSESGLSMQRVVTPTAVAVAVPMQEEEISEENLKICSESLAYESQVVSFQLSGQNLEISKVLSNDYVLPIGINEYNTLVLWISETANNATCQEIFFWANTASQIREANPNHLSNQNFVLNEILAERINR